VLPPSGGLRQHSRKLARGGGNSMKEWLLVLKAADAAARWHVHHRRKGPAEEPYINHLLEVAMLVAEATSGTDTNLVIAALLHDAIEDSEVPQELIAENFGDDVASIVVEVTDDKSLKRVLVVALEMTRVSLGLTDDLADGIIAKQIVELAKTGERNPDLLREAALKKLHEHLFSD
jgi:(p)ppGpp synthase/HD superfamily hydrolase